MALEHESLIKNQTSDLKTLPLGKKPIGYKSMYKVKYKADGTLNKYKAQLVKKGSLNQRALTMRRPLLP